MPVVIFDKMFEDFEYLLQGAGKRVHDETLCKFMVTAITPACKFMILQLCQWIYSLGLRACTVSVVAV